MRMAGTDGTQSPNAATGTKPKQEFSMTQVGMGLLIVGASAGLTLYTKKTQSMLNQFKRVEKNKKMRLPKEKFGPPTKAEWEKIRPRWSNDDL
jgi:hypothetical protein